MQREEYIDENGNIYTYNIVDGYASDVRAKGMTTRRYNEIKEDINDRIVQECKDAITESKAEHCEALNY